MSKVQRPKQLELEAVEPASETPLTAEDMALDAMMYMQVIAQSLLTIAHVLAQQHDKELSVESNGKLYHSKLRETPCGPDLDANDDA